MKRYSPKDIEPKWQKIWDETGVYTANLTTDKPKYVAMSMFNYPSGAGIHIGHAMNYTISDVKARFKRQQGYESYHPVGWDAFGLPAENYAIKAGVSPQESMANIIPDYHKQYKAMGWSNDWEKEIATHLPEYYKWTQWIFTQMHKNNLAYQDSRMQWWCEKDNTVLANEQVIDGKCWRHDSPDDPLVQKKEIKQWFFKITEYADELLEATKDLDWTESVKLAQQNWIGRSEGMQVQFKLSGLGADDETVEVYTTAHDTIFGVTFMVFAPEHPLIEKYLEKAINTEEVRAYIEEAVRKSELDRESEKTKSGIEVKGLFAINPINGAKIPVWVADYVLMGYGTGAVMAVPGEDERDYEFAKKYDLPIIYTTEQQEFINYQTELKKNRAAYRLANSGEFDGLDFETGRTQIQQKLEELGVGRTQVQYKMRDWSVSRQRYWGAPIPIIHCSHCLPDNVKSKIVATIEFVDHSNFSQLINRAKTAITRLKEGKYAHVTEGTVVELIDKATGDKLYAKIIKKRLYSNISELYRDKAITKASFVKDFESEQDLRNQYDTNRPGYSQQLDEQGIFAWEVELLTAPVLVPDEQLPIVLPELTDFKPAGDGRSALARAKDWLETVCPQCGGAAERETDTLDTYICSSWYMYRYFDPRNQQQIFDPKVAQKWEPIDFYNGADHATAHLLYARFVARFFHKLGLLNNPEPFKQFVFNGKVTASDGSNFSKSKGNGVDPLDIIDQGYGADALRTYLMFAAPLELWTRWDAQGVPGAHRFLSRVWNLAQEYHAAPAGDTSDDHAKAILKAVHTMIKKTTIDLEENRYNTAIAASMQCVNELYKLKEQSLSRDEVWQQALEGVVACIAPFAPHIADELWQQLGHSSSIHKDSWPQVNEAYLESDTITIVVQVNGKVRANIEVNANELEAVIIEQARTDPKIQLHLESKPIRKTIYVPQKLVNFVV